MSIPVRQVEDHAGLAITNFVIDPLSADPGSPASFRPWARTDIKRLRYYDSSGNQTIAQLSDTLDLFGAPAASVSWNSQALTNLLTPVNPNDAANKAYVDAAISGLDYHDAVRYMAVAALPAYTYANGTAGVGATITANSHGVWTVDGQSLNVGDRILLPDRYNGSSVAAAASDAGIYIVTTVGTGSVSTVLTRATDFDTATTGVIGTIAAGAVVFVTTGTAAAGSSWLMTQESAITVGTTSLTWSQVGAAGSYSASGTGGLSLSGSAFSANVDDVTIAINGSNELIVDSSGTQYQTLISAGTAGNAPSWGALPLNQAAAVSGQLPIANGGTGAATASAALAALGGTGKYTTTIGNGSATSFVITHGLSDPVIVQVFDNVNSPNDYVLCEVQHTSSTTVTLLFATAPTTNQYKVICIG